MKWQVERNNDDVIIVSMNSNSVNKQDPDFFNDLHECFDHLDNEYPHVPVILTGNEKLFSVGIDFEYCLELFSKQNLNDIKTWFKQFSDAILRVYESNRMTVAAVNGHCFAGGLILALCCDFRFGVQGNSKFSLNEVPVGIPMPATYADIIKYRIGEKNASDAILSGTIYDSHQAKEMNFLHNVVAKQDLLEVSLKQARCITKDAWHAYVHSKMILQAPIIEKIKSQSLPYDLEETIKVISSVESIKAQKAAFERLKKR